MTSLSFRRAVIRSWPFFFIALVLGLVTIWFQNRGIGEEEIVIGSFARRLVNAGMAVWWYAENLFAPVRLMAIYPEWRFDSPRASEWLPLIALLGFLIGVWHWRGTRTRGVFFVFCC